MKLIVLVSFISLILFTGCSQKEPIIKNAQMLELNNLTVSFIKGGDSLMGTYNDKFADKSPRKVILNDFYIDKTEVTNASYKQYIDEVTYKDIRRPVLIDDPIYGADTLPVTGVTHSEADSFCRFYGKRLPTEAEWEYAAKGATTNTEYYWGDKEDPLYMNYRESKKEKPVPVASYPPNRYGLYDMNGNVREWVADSYGRDYYRSVCKTQDHTIMTMLKESYSIIMRPDDMTTSQEDIITRADGLITGAYDKMAETYDVVKGYVSGDGYIPSTCLYNPVNRSKSKFKVSRGGSYDYVKGYPATLSFRFFEKRDSTHMDLGFRCAAYEKNKDDIFNDESEEGNE